MKIRPTEQVYSHQVGCQRPTYRYLSALAGSGKTHLIGLRADRLARAGYKVLIVQPTHLLIAATVKREIEPLAPQYPVTQIHGGTGGAEIVSKITKHFLHAALGQGEIVLITHAAYMLVKRFHAADQWVVIVDEVFMGFLAHDTVRLPDTHSIITDHVEAIPYKPGYSALVIKDGDDHRKAIEAMATNENQDQIYALIQTFAKLLLNDRYAVHVREDRYLAMLRSQDKTNNQIVYYGCLQPTIFAGFREVVVCCAMFEQSLMYMLWRLDDLIDWAPVSAKAWRMNLLKYNDFHLGGSLLTIYYATKQPWSKRYRDEMIEGEDERFAYVDTDGTAKRMTYGKVFTDAIAEFTKDHRDKMCWLGNKDQGDKTIWTADCPERLPSTSHGLNDYDTLPYCAITAAYNPPATLFVYLKAHGLNSDEVRQAIYFANVYQGAMRSAIRDPKNSEYKHVIVMDKDVAEWLAGYFPGCFIQALPGTGLAPDRERKAGRPKVHDDPTSRKAAHRQRISAELLAELIDINVNEISQIDIDQSNTDEFDLDGILQDKSRIDFSSRNRYRFI